MTQNQVYSKVAVDSRADCAITPGEIPVSLSRLPKQKTKALILATITLRDVAKLVRSDTKLQAKTLSVRPLKATDGAKYKELKKWLTRMVPASNAGVGVALAKLPPAEHHNGLYGFDVDENVEDAAALLKIIKQAPGAVMAGRSIGGVDLWCIFAGPKATTAAEYKGLWRAISDGFPPGLKANTAEQSDEFNRARTLAHDPEVWLAESAIPLQVKPAPPKLGKGERASRRGANLQWLKVPQDRNDWLGRLMVLKAAGFGLEEAENWSSKGEKYEPGEVERLWDSLEPEESEEEALAKLRGLAEAGAAGAYVLGDPEMLDDLTVLRRAMEDRGKERDESEGAPKLFMASGAVSRLANGEILRLDYLSLLDELGVDAEWKRSQVSAGEVIVKKSTPRADALKAAVSAESDRVGLPALNSIVYQPVVLPNEDGYWLVEAAGYIEKAGVLSRVSGILPLDLETAKAMLDDAFGFFQTGVNRPKEGTGFRFTDEQAASNAIACLFTPMVRHADRRIIPPMFAISKVETETGASTFLQAAALLSTGQEMEAITWGRDMVELEKSIGTLLLKGAQIIFFDNVLDPGESSLVSTLITEGRVSIRLLGKSKMIPMSGPVTVMMSANKTEVGEDYQKRICQVDLAWGAAKGNEVDLSTEFRHTPFLPWLELHRPLVLSAMCAVLRDALVRLPNIERGKSRFPVWERWANAILDSLGMPHAKVGILTENLETPAKARNDLLGMLLERAVARQQVERFKRDELVVAFNEAGHDPSGLPGVLGLEPSIELFGTGIKWDKSAQKFGSWLAKIVRARNSVEYGGEQWCLTATTDTGSNRQFWMERAENG